jgi:hypothetical protein
MRHVACGIVLLLLCFANIAAAESPRFAGRGLDDALRLLQRQGLPIVFSSEIVTPDMRVAAEPHSTTPRQQLEELLAAHGLAATAGPGGTILVVRARLPAARRLPGHSHSAAPDAPREHSDRASAAAPYADLITVRGLAGRVNPGPSAVAFDTRTIDAASSPVGSDGLEAVRAMPGVEAFDDARSDFSVRGSPYRQIGTVIDGVPTRWLQHAVYGRNDAGSLSMFGSDVLERATLQAGAYPRIYDDTLGAQLELTLREGSREATRFAGSAGGWNAAVMGEGPIASGRGSWIAEVRNSYRAWPPRRLSQNDVGFAFADAHAKLAYDLSPAEQITVTALAGRSAADTPDEPLVGTLASGDNRAGLITIGLRSTFGSQTVVQQRLFLVGQELESTLTTGQLAGRSSNRALGYRGEVLRAVFGGLLHAGAEVSRLSGTRAWLGRPQDVPRVAWTTHAAYVDFARTVSAFTFEGGLRASDSTLVHHGAVTPWVLGAWEFRPGWTLNASVGTSRQYPDLDVLVGAASASDLVPEQATHVDVGVAQELPGVRWRVTLFSRTEDHVLRAWSGESPTAASVDPAGPVGYVNSLESRARGIEVVVAPRNTGKLSGWISYTCAAARQTDAFTRESFWSDVDRRHAFTAVGRFRIGAQTSAGFVLRAASGVPFPAYINLRDEPAVGEGHTISRLPPYMRLDARIQRTYFSGSHGVTVFGEVLNALDRHNSVVYRSIQPASSDASRTATGPSRRVSVGIEFALWR